MDLRQLRYFAVLADELHFRRAAERLHITQAPLSLAIQALERELGSQLFLRTRRRVELTETGEALRADARAILDRVERSRETIRDLAGGKTGHLRIGFTPASSLLPFFPRLISAFHNSHPHVRVVLQEHSSTDQLAALRVHEIDVGIVRNPPRRQASDVSFAKLLTDPLVVAIHRGHRLGHRTRIKVADLRDEAFIFYPRGAGVGIYEQVIALCATRGFAPDIVQEAKESSTLIGLAATGLGVAIVPSGLRHIDVPNILFKPLADPDAITEIHLASRAGEENARVADFRRLAQTVLAGSRGKPKSKSRGSTASR
jgi:DNA-binding transcriptional LysR family regulator